MQVKVIGWNLSYRGVTHQNWASLSIEDGEYNAMRKFVEVCDCWCWEVKAETQQLSKWLKGKKKKCEKC